MGSTTVAWPIKLAPLGPISMGARLWRVSGQLMVTVAAKVTLSFADGARLRTIKSSPVRLADDHLGGHPMRSVIGAAELAPQLRSADVTLVGSARPTVASESHAVRMAVATGAGAVIDKTLAIVGDRRGDGSVASFTELPIQWERAFGGIGFDDNPLGIGFGVATTLAPNITAPEGGADRALGFAPIPASFPVRRKRATTATRRGFALSIMEVPDDLDWTYFQAAPADQQLPTLSGNEWIALDGFSATQPQIRFRLPGGLVATRLFDNAAAAAPPMVPMTLDMLHINTESKWCELVWRGSFPLRAEADASKLIVAAAYQPAGSDGIAWPALDKLSVLPFKPIVGRRAGSAKPASSLMTTVVVDPDDAGEGDRLPFVRSVGKKGIPLGGTVSLEDDDIPGRVTPASRDQGLFGTMTLSDPDTASSSPLPFVESSDLPREDASAHNVSAIPGAPWTTGNVDPVAAALPKQKHTFAADDIPALLDQNERNAKAARQGELQAKAEALARRARAAEAARVVEREAEQVRARDVAEAERVRQEEEARARALAAAEQRRQREAEQFQREQEEARQQRENRAREELAKKADAAKELRSNIYGGFKRKP